MFQDRATHWAQFLVWCSIQIFWNCDPLRYWFTSLYRAEDTVITPSNPDPTNKQVTLGHGPGHPLHGTL